MHVSNLSCKIHKREIAIQKQCKDYESIFNLRIFRIYWEEANMGHGEATAWGEDKAAGKKTKLGIIMFFIYLFVYVGFIFIGVFMPDLMGADVGSLNVAIVYGVGLIIFALVLAFIYNAKCTKLEKEMNLENGKGGDE